MITILDVAINRGIKEDERGNYPATEFDRVGLPFMGGCLYCHASIACYNSYPSKTGYILCKHCIDEESGFNTVEEFEEFIKDEN